MTAMLRTLAVAGVAAVMAACGSQPSAPLSVPGGPAWPTWVLQPEAAGGVAAAECVESSGNLSLDRTQAAAAARVTLARNLEVNIQSSDELLSAKTGAQGSQTFRSSARLLSEKALANTRVSRLEEVGTAKGKWLCAEVTLDAAGTRSLVKDAVAITNTTTNTPTNTAAAADVEEMLLQQFRRRSVPSQVPSQAQKTAP